MPIGSHRGRAWRGRHLVLPLIAAAGTCLLSPGPRGEVRQLTLFEKSGRAPLVVQGAVTDGQHRFAAIEVIDVIRCEIAECPGRTLRIAFRLDSFLRRPWQDKIEFATGERVILFLRKFTKEDGEQPEGDLYTLMWGAQGKHLLPPEGADATVSAARAFVAIHRSQDLDRQAGMLEEAIGNENPILAEGAFEELIKQGLGGLDLVPRLTGFLDHPRESTRVLALRLMRRILDDARVADRPVEGRDQISDLLRGRAALDPSPPFRVEAVRVLDVLGGDEVKAFLAALAREDPSQDVRYEAEKALLGWERRH